jgi:hypothetical protein
MRLITAFELAHLNERELAALFSKASAFLARAEPGSAEHENALATLENVRRALAVRRNRPGP